MPKSAKLTWLQAPADHDYPAAQSFLRLVATPSQVEAISRSLSEVPTVAQHAKDILRAARLPPLPADDPEVARDLNRAGKATPLSPILLVKGNLATSVPLMIADGYHRVCASYHLNEDTEIPRRLVELPTAAL